MHFHSKFLIVTAMAVSLGGSLRADPAQYELDPEHTTVAFLVTHLGFAATLGRFVEVEGQFTYDPDTQDLGDLSVTVATSSIASDNAARDGHLRSGDFLSVEEFPVMTFNAKEGSPASETSGRVTGELTLLGTTLPLTLDVTLNKSGVYPFGHGRSVLGISARGTVKRSDFGMMYGVAGDIVGDEVQLIIETEAMRID